MISGSTKVLIQSGYRADPNVTGQTQTEDISRLNVSPCEAGVRGGLAGIVRVLIKLVRGKK